MTIGLCLYFFTAKILKAELVMDYACKSLLFLVRNIKTQKVILLTKYINNVILCIFNKLFFVSTLRGSILGIRIFFIIIN